MHIVYLKEVRKKNTPERNNIKKIDRCKNGMSACNVYLYKKYLYRVDPCAIVVGTHSILQPI